jgi:hypothetical protein
MEWGLLWVNEDNIKRYIVFWKQLSRVYLLFTLSLNKFIFLWHTKEEARGQGGMAAIPRKSGDYLMLEAQPGGYH